MDSEIFITDEELNKYGNISSYSQKAEALLMHQKEHWRLLNDNFIELNNVQTKRYDFNGYYIKTQFNPARIISSSAKVDKKTITERPCFLCRKNLPDVQKGINYKDEYIILCNPYPIFSQHLTIPFKDHIPQSIDSSLNALLELSFELRDKFFVFYNGPKCGASAPDHLHFQAGIKHCTPLEEYYERIITEGIILFSDSETSIRLVDKDLFRFISIQSDNQYEVEKYSRRIIDQLRRIQSSEEEPLVNIISLYENNRWNIFLVPRKKHRPDEFFLEEDKRLLISPASGDMTGLLITPRKKDFDRINKSVITSIYSQVLMDSVQIENIKRIF